MGRLAYVWGEWKAWEDVGDARAPARGGAVCAPARAEMAANKVATEKRKDRQLLLARRLLKQTGTRAASPARRSAI